MLEAKACRKALAFIQEQGIKAGKIADMLGAADTLFLATWLPEPGEEANADLEEEPLPFEGNIKNMEHIAACSAAIQNVLIGATARDIPNYWSSGGQLRNAALRHYLGVPMQEVMMGAVFLFPKDSGERAGNMKPGALREQGKEIETWSRKVAFE